MDSKKPNYIARLLVICLTCLALLILIITCGNSRYIPTWTDIGRAIFGDETKASDEDMVRFIDVGQGDSILISSNGYNALIDFGDQSDYGSELLDALRSYKIERLDCIIVSHYDMDHVGGAPKILKALDVEYALLPELSDKEANDFDDFQYALENSGAEVSIARVGTLVNIGDFDITVIGHFADAFDSNDRSVVLMAECDGKKFLLTGDAGANIEQRLIEEGINLDCDVYKAAHHGSRNSNTLDFIKAASPEYGVISCSSSNQYGHPHTEVLTNLETVEAKIYRTDRSGDITFKIENGEIIPSTEY